MHSTAETVTATPNSRVFQTTIIPLLILGQAFTSITHQNLQCIRRTHIKLVPAIGCKAHQVRLFNHCNWRQNHFGCHYVWCIRRSVHYLFHLSILSARSSICLSRAVLESHLRIIHYRQTYIKSYLIHTEWLL